MEKEKLIIRTRKIKGQIEGIERMIEKERDCEDILIQLKASEKALMRLGEQMIKCNIDECLKNEKSKKKVKEKVESLVSAVLKM